MFFDLVLQAYKIVMSEYMELIISIYQIFTSYLTEFTRII